MARSLPRVASSDALYQPTTGVMFDSTRREAEMPDPALAIEAGPARGVRPTGEYAGSPRDGPTTAPSLDSNVKYSQTIHSQNMAYLDEMDAWLDSLTFGKPPNAKTHAIPSPISVTEFLEPPASPVTQPKLNFELDSPSVTVPSVESGWDIELHSTDVTAESERAATSIQRAWKGRTQKTLPEYQFKMWVRSHVQLRIDANLKADVPTLQALCDSLKQQVEQLEEMEISSAYRKAKVCSSTFTPTYPDNWARREGTVDWTWDWSNFEFVSEWFADWLRESERMNERAENVLSYAQCLMGEKMSELAQAKAVWSGTQKPLMDFGTWQREKPMPSSNLPVHGMFFFLGVDCQQQPPFWIAENPTQLRWCCQYPDVFSTDQPTIQMLSTVKLAITAREYSLAEWEKADEKRRKELTTQAALFEQSWAVRTSARYCGRYSPRVVRLLNGSLVAVPWLSPRQLGLQSFEGIPSNSSLMGTRCLSNTRQQRSLSYIEFDDDDNRHRQRSLMSHGDALLTLTTSKGPVSVKKSDGPTKSRESKVHNATVTEPFYEERYERALTYGDDGKRSRNVLSGHVTYARSSQVGHVADTFAYPDAGSQSGNYGDDDRDEHCHDNEIDDSYDDGDYDYDDYDGDDDANLND